MIADTLIVRWLGRQDYPACWQAMREFTQSRQEDRLDEIWLLEHNAIFTQGQNGRSEHILDTGTIPVIKTDRGGQITYHGPGQLMVYTLIDIKRKKMHVREFVSCLEQSVIDFLSSLGIEAESHCQAPGVYIDQKKICSIGLRIRRGCTYHGIAFNIAMDLSPFQRIHPCGFTDLQMTHLSEQLDRNLTSTKSEYNFVNNKASRSQILHTALQLMNYLMKNLRYTKQHFINDHLEKADG